MPEAVLEVRDLVAGYGQDVPVVAGVSLCLHAGEMLAVIGPNGAGKSTLLKGILGIVPQVRGTVLVRSKPVRRLDPRRLVDAGVGFVPQGHQVFPQMSVRENLEMGCFWLKGRETRRAVEAGIDSLPQLRPLLDRQAGVLSGGEQQLVSFARALAAAPGILLVDEPSAGLSPKNTEFIYQILDGLRSRGMAILMVEQNARRALELADRGIVLDLGAVRFDEPAAELLRDPRVRGMYLGGARQ